ncbi:MAG TPA: sulfite exporter TauE/SafE family protein [Candidatus Ozemobacteraceae bacterium]|nr:sulfite exporter TauE/SafE family protein [Candidatus Ozemobacteraceae bacterium]
MKSFLRAGPVSEKPRTPDTRGQLLTNVFSRRFAISWLVLVVWSLFMWGTGSMALFRTYWPVSLTMTLGSFVSGATAEGGGAVAFPVFTKLLHIPSDTARDFALAIQSVGMTCGGLIIIRSGYAWLPHVFGWALAGAATTLIPGFLWLAPQVPPPYPKIIFTLFTLCFGYFLWNANRRKRNIQNNIDIPPGRRLFGFFLTGALGGLISSLVGSGADVLLFVVLCLRYDVDERVGTRTTVILMASVSTIGFLFRLLSGTLAPDVLPMWLCAAPIVAFGAPLGAAFCSGQARENVVRFLLALIGIEFVSTLLLVPFDRTAVCFSLLFVTVALTCMRLLKKRCADLPEGG